MSRLVRTSSYDSERFGDTWAENGLILEYAFLQDPFRPFLMLTGLRSGLCGPEIYEKLSHRNFRTDFFTCSHGPFDVSIAEGARVPIRNQLLGNLLMHDKLVLD